jgi:hypothetical protein
MQNNQPDAEHLDDIEDGAGSVEIWEKSSEACSSSPE